MISALLEMLSCDMCVCEVKSCGHSGENDCGSQSPPCGVDVERSREIAASSQSELDEQVSY